MEVVVGESGETLSLKARVEKLPYEKITPDLRARLAVEMVKDAVNTGKLTQGAAQEFAKSLIEDCSVPLVIGTPSVKIFLIENIVLARPFVVANLKEAAGNEGIDYGKATETRKQKAKEIILVLEREYERQNAKYGSFAQYLSPEERSEEMNLQAKLITAAKQVLQGEKIDEIKTDESILRFMQTDVANVYFGEELQDWLKNQ